MGGKETGWEFQGFQGDVEEGMEQDYVDADLTDFDGDSNQIMEMEGLPRRELRGYEPGSAAEADAWEIGEQEGSWP